MELQSKQTTVLRFRPVYRNLGTGHFNRAIPLWRGSIVSDSRGSGVSTWPAEFERLFRSRSTNGLLRRSLSLIPKRAKQGHGATVDSRFRHGHPGFSYRAFSLTREQAYRARDFQSAILGFMADVTQILSQIEQGDSSASEQLLPLVYEELRKLAAAKMAQEQPGQTLQATALVHDAYLRLVDGERAKKWDSRGHFYCAAAEAMRRILIESARRKNSHKRGGQVERVDLKESCLISSGRSDDLIAVDEALSRLEELDATRAKLVKLRFYAGMTVPEAAVTLGVSRATAERYWTFAKTWLYCELDKHRSE